MAWTLEKILEGARTRGASDIHLIRGLAPVLRINGDIFVSQGRPLDEAALGDLIDRLLLPKQRETLQEQLQLCFSRQAEGVGRFRASVYFHAGCPELAIRLCEKTVRTAAELGLPPVIEELARLHNGLILLTGPTGTGKTTTLNFMVDLINHSRRAKIVTIEDPVEFVHDNLRSIIVQQEVGTDVHSFREAWCTFSPGPRRDRYWRNARPGDHRNGNDGGGDRPPGAGDVAHARYGADDPAHL